MPEDFDVSTWRSRVRAWWREIARDTPGAMSRLGVRTSYGLLTASAWLPLLSAYSSDPGPAVAALAGVLSGVGTNLLSNLVQGAYDRETAPQQAEQEVAERAELRAEYQQVLAGLDVVRLAQEGLGENWAAFEAQLRGELTRFGGELRIDSGGGTVIFGPVTVSGGGDFVAGDVHEHHHYPGPRAPDVEPLRQAYLRHVAERCGRLPLRALDARAADATARAQQPCLAHVYIDLDTTASAFRGTGGAAKAGKPAEYILTDSPDEAVEHVIAQEGRVSMRENEPFSALDTMIMERHAVLLGAPGSGKSTFSNHLTYCLAMAQLEPAAGWLEHLPGWPEEAAGALPLVVTLRDLARRAVAREEEEGTARTIDDFVSAWLDDHALGEFAGPLREEMRRGNAVILLDGLDEVPTPALRRLVRDAVAVFARTYAPCRIVVTCRTLSYQEPEGQLPPDRFPVFELAPFDRPKIDGFIEAWYSELAELGAVEPEEREGLAGGLRQAVRRPDLQRLAPNPLLLTVMALVHAHKGRLPEARALLYEECTDLLLWRWEQHKGQAGRERQPGLRDLLTQAGLQDVDLMGALWALAFKAHATGGSEDDPEATSGISEERLLRELRGLHPEGSWDWAAAVASQMKERAGLLVEQEPGVYAFPHRTFQEYLAGCHLSVQPDFAQRAADLLAEGTFWREVVLLAVGRLVHVAGDLPRPLALVAELCPGAEPADERGWRDAWWAGEVLLEAGAGRVARTALGREQLDRARRRLAALLDGGHLAPRERAEAGDVLGRLGDPRPGVAAISKTPGGASLPDFLWVEVPARSFLMGSGQDDRDSRPNEKPQQELEILYRYWLARFATTVAQYRCFLEAGGYDEPRWWTATGWSWRQGEWDSQVEESWLRDWLARRPAAQRAAPLDWDAQCEHPNRPVIYVSWFEAVAFGRWLTEHLEAWGWRLHVWRDGGVDEIDLPGTGLQCRLPTEAEWENAARSGETRRYPWGDEDWQSQKANVGGSIGNPTPVGIYPQGATPSGAHDLAGNVWEWTASLYRPYPYHADDGRNDLKAEGHRVVRGGSWFDNQRYARCAARDGYIPDYCDFNLGFRLVVSLASSVF